MNRNRILNILREWYVKDYINGYLYDALTDGSAYAEEWLDELEECGSREELRSKVDEMFEGAFA